MAMRRCYESFHIIVDHIFDATNVIVHIVVHPTSHRFRTGKEKQKLNIVTISIHSRCGHLRFTISIFVEEFNAVSQSFQILNGHLTMNILDVSHKIFGETMCDWMTTKTHHKHGQDCKFAG